ncbi:MAG TPA: MerR family transcriptional regulator [Chondromyces sp.]|nr:MerR family transcriptional regulator [Chondromyces sp.]
MPLKEEGQIYNFNGKEVRLYTISAIVSELEKNGMKRTAQTIRKWEKQGVIPPTGFRDGSKRLYTEAYIDRLVEVLADIGMGKHTRIKSSEWKKDAWQVLIGHGTLFLNFPPLRSSHTELDEDADLPSHHRRKWN